MSKDLLSVSDTMELLEEKLQVPKGHFSIVRLLAALPPNDRELILARIVGEGPKEEEYDKDWVDMDLDFED